ncbi:hypothetical protein SELMODRAFT_441904 [Selaginella moellendorffii]|uniref:Uncharacterized protein SmKC1_1 n=2 Tax=Selaginella moellendorffii TaxID=88036 RepID=D8RNM3_SELML|nr:calcium-activated potassium channel subunit alpha-1 isoform X1 [Selaginella moellendorffii]EFJ25888.1 hypothetical protein SELMODRAFT_441904 [Selaginella moellendorffii]|eukprot:XP_002972667.1 calcium-activated potassium channel subunit alpha-1 isoform X1 [Selaginella moellendorffii]
MATVRRNSRSDIEHETSRRGDHTEVTVPALETNAPYSGKKAVTRSRTLSIAPTGQCTPILDDDELGSNLEPGSRPRESEEQLDYSLGKFRGSAKYFFVRSLLWFKDRGEGKKVDATEDVLARYHNLYLYGAVPLTIKVRTAIRSGSLGHILLCLEFLAAMLSIVAYLRSTYAQTTQLWAITVRKIVALFFVADYLLKVYIAPVRFYYITSVTGVVDLLSTLSILSLWSKFRNEGAIPQMLLVLRALRILPSFAAFGIVGGTVGQQIFLLTMYTLGAVFIAAGILQWVEYKATSAATKAEEGCDPEGCFTFYDAFYFIVVTITTVGYGDFTPKSNLGRLVTLAVMLIAALILPAQFSKILQLASRRPYGGRIAVQNAIGCNFIVISGKISFQTVRHFLSGFYHPSHDKNMAAFPVRVVVMAPFKPSYDMKTLLNRYEGRVEFIEGTPMKESDLDRVCASFATAVFLLADEHAKDFDAEDSAQITRTLSVHRYCGPNVRVIVELLKPENSNNAIWDETESGIEIICPEAVRFQLLARSCHVRGFSTFVINLFRSGSLLSHANPCHWMSEYNDGLRQEIFPVILPSYFHEESLKYEEAVEIVYMSYNVILIGLDVVLLNKTRAVKLYPRGRLVTPSDIGLVIAKDLETAEAVSKHSKSKRSIKRAATGVKVALKSIKKSRQHDMETGIGENTDSSSINRQQTDLQAQFRHFYKPSIDEQQQNQSLEVDFVSSLEEAIDAAMQWPPLRKRYKPVSPVLERRADAIQANLEQRTMRVVLLPRPHILVCIEGKWPLNLFYFVSNLRTTPPVVPVVILHPNTPSAPDWGCVGFFDDVFFVKGSALFELDLVRAGVFQAQKVVILTQRFEDDDSKPREDTVSSPVNTLDVKNIVIAANVERLVSPARDRVLVELQQENQLQFLRPHYKIDAMQFHHKDFQRNSDAKLQFCPPFTAGKGLCPAAFTFLTYATYFNRNTLSIIEQLSCGRRVGDDEDGEVNSIRKLELIAVPDCYIGLSFGEMFAGLLRNDKASLALGLYRPPGTHCSLVSYVSTNPTSSVQLVYRDLIYILH